MCPRWPENYSADEIQDLNQMGYPDRDNAVNAVAAMPSERPMTPRTADLSGFGCDVFNRAVMRRYLSSETAAKLFATMNNGDPLDAAIAADVAHAMKNWAMERGATHYTHWFQPLTGSTAEKHDAFLDLKDGMPIASFSGSNLIFSEPDASSFPSGGLRSTFEARGYTAWDPTSPAFIKRHGNGATLCIPTAFCSYNGDALDKKTPLLRSIQVLAKATSRLMKCFNRPEAKTEVTAGLEQEYFLIDRRFYLQRPDLIQCGRTVFGAPPAKHQQLEDHYFGSMRMRVLDFMDEVEQELWSLGIPAKTRHNEVAPAQFELAPLFEDVNLACDHNMLIMEVLRQAAERRGFVCLLHEKPFNGINGSGKHNNWSVSYGGKNLLSPGDDPHQNAIFLTVLCAVIEAVDLHADLLRAAAAGAGNDCRLGGNEAPPPVISIYLGDQLTDVISQLEKGTPTSSRKAGAMRIGVDTLPPLPRDATDRNRTSPFAFTGNKFEFRTPGACQSCSGCNAVLNTIVAEAFDRTSEVLEKLDRNGFNSGLQRYLQGIVKRHKRIIFNGDGYTGAWAAEAERRGLPRAGSALDSIKAFTAAKNIAMFSKYGVLNERELKSRYEVCREEYIRKIKIEAGVAAEIVSGMIIPAVAAEYAGIAAAIASAAQTGISAGTAALRGRAELLGEGLDRLDDALTRLKAADFPDIPKVLSELRSCADELETEVSDALWQLPKYREMLFIY